MRHCALLVTGLALLLIVGCGLDYGYRSTTSLSQAAEHVDGTSIIVRSRNGIVRLIASPSTREVVIEARVTCGGASKAEADQRVAAATIDVTRTADRSLRIQPVFPGGERSGDGAGLTITLPGAEGVDVLTSNGGVTVDGLAGTLVVATSNGAVDVLGHRGPVDVRTSNGAVDITDASGPVSADTSNARVAVGLTDDAPGPVQVTSSNGSITVRVGDSFGGRVRMETSNGRVSVSDPGGRARAVEIGRAEGSAQIGDGGARSRLRTSNASIKLHVR